MTRAKHSLNSLRRTTLGRRNRSRGSAYSIQSGVVVAVIHLSSSIFFLDRSSHPISTHDYCFIPSEGCDLLDQRN
ncbi:hypothetical protein RHMOL_Rhmol02G0292500 [Rhododendron molle]|uniref:Uncharacterized protein n=1 Tax=Rhododendron molle TaxID=49168 RepID=A0ACC0PX74_RHOML|nr:hypothetical protein RHMOL_Rhmol02G0292500 [Rhododendron molle]